MFPFSYGGGLVGWLPCRSAVPLTLIALPIVQSLTAVDQTQLHLSDSVFSGTCPITALCTALCMHCVWVRVEGLGGRVLAAHMGWTWWAWAMGGTTG